MKGYWVKLTVQTSSQWTTSCCKNYLQTSTGFMKYRYRCVTSSSLLDARLILSLRGPHQYGFPLIFATWQRMFSVLLLLACTVAKALGFAVPAFWSWKSCGFPKGMCLLLTCCRMCLAGDDDLAKNTAPKCFTHDGLLLHQIQQLFPLIAIFCRAVLCQFSLLSLKRMHSGELIHQPSD